MKHSQSTRIFAIALGAAILAAPAFAIQAETTLSQSKETAMTHATGPFDVKLNSLDAYNTADATMGRRAIDKQFHGDLEGTSKGEMLSVGSGTAKGSGGYVAIERVTGTLSGRKGSFALQHNATMTQGEPYLNIIVVPGSGTGELEGLTGKMNIIIAEGGKHSYDFEYSLPAQR